MPYEVTFNTMKGYEVDEWAKFLGIRQAFERAIVGYDLVFMLLGENYLRAAFGSPRSGSLCLPVETCSNQTFIFLASSKSANYIRDNRAKTYVLPLSNAEAKHYRYGLVGLKGFLFKRFAECVARDRTLLQKVYDELLELPRNGKVNPQEKARRLGRHAQMYRELLEELGAVLYNWQEKAVPQSDSFLPHYDSPKSFLAPLISAYRNIGYHYIALGGLLKADTTMPTGLRFGLSAEELDDLLTWSRPEFVLGGLALSRLEILRKHEVWADSTNWLWWDARYDYQRFGHRNALQEVLG